jgi:sugar lactone lactonase YvrE
MKTHPITPKTLAAAVALLMFIPASISTLAAQIIWSTYAGGTGEPGNADGAAHEARFRDPDGIAVDRLGNVYVSDRSNNTIRKITPDGTVSTLAGLAGSSGFVNGQGGNARFNYPRGLSVDGEGNIYVSDRYNNAIRKITPDGEVTTHSIVGDATDVVLDRRGNVYSTDFLAGGYVMRNDEIYYGNLTGIPSADNSNRPIALAMSHDDRLYVFDVQRYRLHEVWQNTNGKVLAGGGDFGGSGSADGLGAAARFSQAAGIAVDRDHNVYVADTLNHRIRMVTQSGMVSTIGANPSALGLVEGVGRYSTFMSPTSIAIGPDGAIYVANRSNHNIVKGVVAGPEIKITQWLPDLQTSRPLDTPAKISFQPAVVQSPSTVTIAVENTGVMPLQNVALSLSGAHASQYSFVPPPDTIAPGERILVNILCTGVDPGPKTATLTVASNDVDEAISTIALTTNILPVAPGGEYHWDRIAGSSLEFGFTGGPALDALLGERQALAFARNGDLYIVRPNSHSISRLDHKTGLIRNVAGMATRTGSADGLAINARFVAITDIAVSNDGVIYVAELSSRRIRMISANGVVSTALATVNQISPHAIFYDEIRKRLLISDQSQDAIFALNLNGTLTLVAGKPGIEGSQNGAALDATFKNPAGITMDAAGNLYVCDSGNYSIRRISSKGMVSTFAGIPGTTGNIDGLAGVATMAQPYDIASMPDGSFIFVSLTSHVVRKILPTGQIVTIGGMAGSSGSAAGTASVARFNSPSSVAISPEGRIHVASSGFITRSTGIAPELVVVADDGMAMNAVNSAEFISPHPGTVTRTFTCKNIGLSSHPAMMAYITGLHANRFTIASALPRVPIPAGGILTFAVTYQPQSLTTSKVSLRLGASRLAVVTRQFAMTGRVIDAMSTWSMSHFGSSASMGETMTLDDPDGDGFSNLVEYAFNLDPMQRNSSQDKGLPQSRILDLAQGRHLQLEFVRRREDSNPGISYVAEFSSDLIHWQPANIITSAQEIDSVWERVVMSDPAGAGESKRFGRVRLTVTAEVDEE